MSNPAQKPLPENDTFSIQRGDYGSSFFTKSLFLIGRLATGPIQYALIRAHPLGYFGIARPPTGSFIHVLGHTVPRLPFLTALMPAIHSLKHALWITAYCNERVTLPFAIFGILVDLTYESVSSLVFSGASINPLFSERAFYIGSTIFYTSLAVETVAEMQRAAFKAKPENKGQLCTTGFWSITRHINYTMNVMFGLGFGLATGGPGYAVACAGMYLSNFITNVMPSIEGYCKAKYGSRWEAYTKKTRWQLIPGVY